VSSFPISDFQADQRNANGFKERKLSRVETHHISRDEWTRDDRDRSVRQDKLKTFFRRLILVLVGILILEVIIQFLIIPRLIITTVKLDVPVSFPMGDDNIMAAAGLTGILNYFSVDTVDAVDRLERIPLIASAEITKSFPKTMTISLTPRKALACALIQGEAGMIPMVLDNQGVVFASGYSKSMTDMPIISGVKFPDPQVGMRLPETVLPFLMQLEDLKGENPSLFNLVSEFKLVKRGVSDYDVLLFLRGYQTKVRIGSEIDEDLLKYVLMVLDVTSREGINSTLEELDFRSSRIVYRTREEQ